MNFWFFTFTLLLSGGGCVAEVRRPSTQEVARSSIYSAVLEEVIGAMGGESPVVLEMPVVLNDKFLDQRRPPEDIWQAFTRAARGPVSFDGRAGQVVFISSAEKARLFGEEGAGGWERFFQEFPGAGGLLSFSEVAVDKSGESAFVYAFLGCGRECGFGDLYQLKEDGGSWRVERRLIHYSS